MFKKYITSYTGLNNSFKPNTLFEILQHSQILPSQKETKTKTAAIHFHFHFHFHTTLLEELIETLEFLTLT